MHLGQQSWIHHTHYLIHQRSHPGDDNIASYYQELSEMLLPKGYSLCSQIRRGKFELKRNPIVIPPLNVEIHTVEFTFPNQKWNV